MATLQTPRNTAQPMLAPGDAENLKDFMANELADIAKYHAAFVSITAQLDADAGITDTDYTSENPAALTLVEQAHDFEARNPVAPLLVFDVQNFIDSSAQILVDLGVIRTAFAALTAKLDADAGITDTDYNSLDLAALTVVALTDSEVEARNTVAPMLSSGSWGEIRDHSALVVADLAALRAGLVALTAQLDADAGITDTDYATNNDPAAATVVALTA